MYKNLIFDLGNVLFCIDETASIETLCSLMDASKCGDDWERNFFYPHIMKYETGAISTVLFVNGLLFYARREVQGLDVIEAWNKMLLGLNPEAIPFLEILKRQYRLFLLSNINELHYKGFARLLKPEISLKDFEDLFDKSYYSHLISKRKPQRDCYEFVIRDAEISPGETLFIDDKIENVKGAIQVGLDGLHLEKPCDYMKIRECLIEQ